MDKIIFFDLDETLINTSYRQYSVIKDFLNSKQLSPSTYEEYLDVRKNKEMSNGKYFKLFTPSEELYSAFKNFYLDKIESEFYLNFDQLIVDRSNLQSLVDRGYSMYLLSLRSNEVASRDQLKKLEIFNYFKSVYFTSHSLINPKIQFLKDWRENHEKIDLFIGDSYIDFEASTMNDVKFLKVKTGIYHYENIKSESFLNVNKLIKYILKNGI